MANEYAVNQTDLTAVADAIRSKGGTADTLSFPDGFVEAVQAITSGSGDSSGDEYAYFKKWNNGELTDVVLPEDVKSIRHSAFAFYKSLKSITALGVTKLSESVFANCTALETVNIPNFSYMYGAKNSFSTCTALKSISFPNLTDLGSSSTSLFSGCTALTDVDLPIIEEIAAQTFNSCTSIAKLDLPAATHLGGQCFYKCSALIELILRADTVCTLVNVNAFGSTPFASGGTGGTVYVPEALIEDYKTATNWVTLYEAGSLTFAAIEGSEYE